MLKAIHAQESTAERKANPIIADLRAGKMSKAADIMCCKPDVSDGGIGLALLYPAVSRALVLLAIMDIRAHLLSFVAGR
jgi:hypothetical protein